MRIHRIALLGAALSLLMLPGAVSAAHYRDCDHWVRDRYGDYYCADYSSRHRSPRYALALDFPRGGLYVTNSPRYRPGYYRYSHRYPYRHHRHHRHHRDRWDRYYY